MAKLSKMIDQKIYVSNIHLILKVLKAFKLNPFSICILFSMGLTRFLLVSFVVGLVISSSCGPGGVHDPSGKCFNPFYIEGCFTYTSET